jgi:hypothetical protein
MRRKNGQSDDDLQAYFSSTYNVPNLVPDSRSHDQMYEVIVAEIPNNPTKHKPADRTDVRKFSLMLATQL